MTEEREKPSHYLLLVQETRYKDDYEHPKIYVFTDKDAFMAAWVNLEMQMKAGKIHGFRSMVGWDFKPAEVAVQAAMF